MATWRDSKDPKVIGWLDYAKRLRAKGLEQEAQKAEATAYRQFKRRSQIATKGHHGAKP